jgi:hypothetical protein
MALEAERQAQLQAAVYSNDATHRERHTGVVMWLDSVLAGRFEENYTAQAKEELRGPRKPAPEQDEGTPWMANDGLDTPG